MTPSNVTVCATRMRKEAAILGRQMEAARAMFMLEAEHDKSLQKRNPQLAGIEKERGSHRRLSC